MLDCKFKLGRIGDQAASELIDLMCRKPLVEYHADTGEFHFSPHNYEIPASDMKSPKMQAHWFRHMAEKEWVTKQHLADFAIAVEEYLNG